jgi:hypothetical protein
MILYEKIKLWKNYLNLCINGIFKFNTEANIESLGILYTNYISELKEVHHILNNSSNEELINIDIKLLDILDLYENIHNFLKKKIYLFLNDKIINYLKSQKLRSFSYSNNIENISLDVNLNIIKSDNIYIEIQELISNEFIISECTIIFKNIINRGSLSLRIYLNNIIKKNVHLSRGQKYKLLYISGCSSDRIITTIKNSNGSDGSDGINNIQLIHYPIYPIYCLNPELNISSEVNSLKIKIPNATYFTKYDIDPLINKKYTNSGNILSALSENLINRLNTIINIPIDNFSEPKILPKSTISESQLLISNSYILKPAMVLKENNNFKYYPFGGINLYNKKIINTTESVILNNIKDDQFMLNTIKNKFTAAVTKKEIQPIMYSFELLSTELIKQFKIRFNELIAFFEKNKIELTYIHFFNFIFGNEYSNDIFIAKALKLIHIHEYNKFILSAQIINPSLNIKQLEKELIINQKLILDTNGLDLWNSIKNAFINSNIFENNQLLPINEQYENIKYVFKNIINTTAEEKNTLECIPNSIKIYSIIYSF